jgi:prepilin-type N-terminal cleavage/methylation domain-containing protein
MTAAITTGNPMTLQLTNLNRSRGRTEPGRAGFTLIELMISIALVVFLIFGINQVFLYTSQAVGTGEAINTGIRDSRAAQGTFAGDFSAMIVPGSSSTESACLIIQNSQVPAYSSATDQAGSRSGNVMWVDLANSGREGDPAVPGDIIPYTVYNFRNHRTDSISFFARDLFHRQTGNLGTYADNMASEEAWIWYGHLILPDNNGNYADSTKNALVPGYGTRQSNPNNLYGSQFVLGRQAILLREKSTDTYGATIQDPSGNYQRFFDRVLPYPTAANPAQDLQPLAMGTAVNQPVPADASTNPATNSAWQLQNSRYDLAATSIAGFQKKLVSYLGNAQLSQTPPSWWTQMMTPTSTSVLSPTSYAGNRFQCNPFVPKPMDSAGLAQSSPYFLGGCSQFTVEFAGDYMVQNNNPAAGVGVYGQVTGAGLDGQIDYVLIKNTDGSYRKQIIWYGLPRSTNGSGAISFATGDVMPLNDWLKNAGQTNLYSFEKVVPIYQTQGNPSTMTNGSQYICAFGPNDRAPSLIRITITITDPSGRIPDGLTYQYVFKVPPQIPQQ